MLILRWIINALLLMLVPYLVPGVTIANFYTALIAALALALVNAVIRPFIVLLTLPVNILTLGLFTLIINAVLFWFVSSAVKGFAVTGFWPAFWAALIFSVLSVIINYLLRSKK